MTFFGQATRVTDLRWALQGHQGHWLWLTSHLPQITLFVLKTIYLGEFEFNGSLPFMLPRPIYQLSVHVSCQFTYLCHKSDLWRHRGDMASSMSTLRPKYSIKMYQNTSMCRIEWGSYLWRFHAATIDSFADMDGWSYKTLEFQKFWHLTCHLGPIFT